MDGLAITLAATLAWTNPSINADTLGCSAGALPLSDLAFVDVYLKPLGFGASRLVATLDAHGREGLQSSTQVPAGVWYAWVIARDSHNNWSCSSNRVVVGAALDVPPGATPALRYYDLAGRALHGSPSRAGVYFVRGQDGRSRRLVVIR